MDCFGARVRAGERESEPGELFICAKKRTSTFVLVLFFNIIEEIRFDHP
ncbi:MAG TPA: hypothetical protein IAA37_02715 [Candidatus Eubacterium faecale]|uniref:Uncharacterized protein n=1 Tax=Candidatus Eubacterium faecale TaxID=2838568 RepID=A0A9D2MI74_9FIRM|nr:hypothetical protein [Candidatus Eubacterium faecale]